MPSCNRCAQQNATSARFCVNCGAAQPVDTALHLPQEPGEGSLSAALRAQPPAGSFSPPVGKGSATLQAAALVRGGAPEELAEASAESEAILVGFVVSFETTSRGVSWTLRQGKVSLGRTGSAAAIDIDVPHATVSSLHATFHISARPSRVLLVDENSTNGTFVNNHELPSRTQQELSDGDTVRFGLYSAIIKIL